MAIINPQDVLVTTGDLRCDYEIIGPVYFQVSNKGFFSNALAKYVNKHSSRLAEMKKHRSDGYEGTDWGWIWGEWSVGQGDFEKAFFIGVEELKERAVMLGADAIICLRQDIDLDTNGFQFFYLQMYGTAVRRK